MLMPKNLIYQFYHYFIAIYLLIRVTNTQGEENPCSTRLKTSSVSFTQYKRVSDREWNEYYGILKETAKPGAKFDNVRKGFIPINQYAYDLPPWMKKGCDCKKDGSNCTEDQKKKDQNESNTGMSSQDCDKNREGTKCEHCRANFFKSSNNNCVACNCNAIGSFSPQCNDAGICNCKSGVTGKLCDSCAAGFYSLGPNGCKTCSCSNPGEICDLKNGICRCKDNVEGESEGFRCGKCKPGYFNFEGDNPLGCTPCFCYDHSSVCESAKGYAQVEIESKFGRSVENWSAEDKQRKPVKVNHNAFTQNLRVNSVDTESTYFLAPSRFLGDQKVSYNQYFSFSLRVNEFNVTPSEEDIIFEGAGLKVSQALIGVSNTSSDFNFKLNEYDGWTPRLPAFKFISLLANLTVIKIRGTYSANGIGFLDNVVLRTAKKGASGKEATWVEVCNCPEGYSGRQCEKCSEGFYGSPLFGIGCKPCKCIDPRDCLHLKDESIVCMPKHVTSILFPKKIENETIMRNQLSHDDKNSQISRLTSEEIEKLPEYEFVKTISVPTLVISDDIRK